MVNATIQKSEAAHGASQQSFTSDSSAPALVEESGSGGEEMDVSDSTDDEESPVEGQAGEAGDELVDQAGRPLGNRAIQTRQRILDATVELLAQKSLRDLKVIDIARRIGSSPATFYQYFKDVEDVVLHLAEQVTPRTEMAVQMIHGGWEGAEGFERAKFLVGRAMDHWEEYGPVLRVRNNAADEGDQRFADVRFKAIMPMVKAFTEEITFSQRQASEAGADPSPPPGKDAELGKIHPTAGAFAAFAMIDRISMYRPRIEGLGLTREEIVESVASVLQFILTRRQ